MIRTEKIKIALARIAAGETAYAVAKDMRISMPHLYALKNSETYDAYKPRRNKRAREARAAVKLIAARLPAL